MRKICALLLVLAFAPPALATPLETGYRSPSQSIIDLVDMAPPVEVIPSPDGRHLLMLERPPLPMLAELAAPELRLAGIRFNPDNLAPSMPRYFASASLRNLLGDAIDIAGLPQPLRILDLAWSPNGESIAWLQLESDGVELWRIDLPERRAMAWGGHRVHAAWGRFGGGDIGWLPDSSAVIFRRIPDQRSAPPERDPLPAGPIVTETRGRMAPTRTFQDLLGDIHDEAVFNHHFTTRLVRVDLDGTLTPLTAPSVVASFSISPDGKHVLYTRLRQPYSYAVPVSRFGHELLVIDGNGEIVYELADNPLADDLPLAFDAVIPGPRGARWRGDADATLTWTRAADDGDPGVEAEVRDQLFQLSAPFDGEPELLLNSPYRIVWTLAGDGETALVWQRWWENRSERMTRVAPDQPGSAIATLWERNWEDRYGDPGRPMMQTDTRGQSRLLMDGAAIFLAGQGGSPEGDRPFVDRLDLDSGETERLWRSQAPWFERPLAFMDSRGRELLTQRESVGEPPDFFLRNLDQDRDPDQDQNDLRRITHTEHPLPELRDIQRELITFDRQDGVTLSATLLLPPGYDSERDGPLPTVMWAYPREFLSADAAGQLADSPYRFNRLSYWNAEFLVTLGYAVFNNVTMPVIGAEGIEPNDRFIEEITLNAEAAIAAGVARGVTDPDRVAVGGHSYGAFMTASLLAHTDLFRTGIARSGAYNRSLTPFGFQREQRTLWDDTDLYIRVSPFFHAHRISAPVLIIHGSEDNNSGTFPMQSERLYQAIRGLGGTARLVMLPLESHGYRGRESVLHMLYETIGWLDEHLAASSD